jgi:hypothetical protein
MSYDFHLFCVSSFNVAALVPDTPAKAVMRLQKHPVFKASIYYMVLFVQESNVLNWQFNYFLLVHSPFLCLLYHSAGAEMLTNHEQFARSALCTKMREILGENSARFSTLKQ